MKTLLGHITTMFLYTRGEKTVSGTEKAIQVRNILGDDLTRSTKLRDELFNYYIMHLASEEVKRNPKTYKVGDEFTYRAHAGREVTLTILGIDGDTIICQGSTWTAKTIQLNVLTTAYRKDNDIYMGFMKGLI